VRAENILPLIEHYDFFIDGTDNFAAKFLINDACVLAGRPYSHGRILMFSGQTMQFASAIGNGNGGAGKKYSGCHFGPHEA
jgi:molybdopterin/thiamine biosynthesis adenylyltransferase